LNGDTASFFELGEKKLMASMAIVDTSVSEWHKDPSVTNAHCFFCWPATYSGPTCTTNPTVSNSLHNPYGNYTSKHRNIPWSKQKHRNRKGTSTYHHLDKGASPILDNDTSLRGMKKGLYKEYNRLNLSSMHKQF